MNRITPAISLFLSLALASCGAAQKSPSSASERVGYAAPDSAGAASPGADAPADHAGDYEGEDDADYDAPEASAADDGDDGDYEEEPAAEPAMARSEAPRARSRVASRTPAPRRPADRPAIVQRAGVKAGEWDDNANYREFQRFLDQQNRYGSHVRVDISDRQFLVVRDAQGKAVPGCAITVSDDQQRTASLTTMSSGRAILFPRAEGLRGQRFTASARCLGSRETRTIDLAQSGGVTAFDMKGQRQDQQRRTIDIAFVLDSTGSMSEEIAAVKATIHSVASTLDELGVSARIGLVEFKDRSDRLVTRVYPMTPDFQGFARDVASIRASGGGDTPESVNEGLHVALDELAWNRGATARLAFLIGDAPPHLDYQQDVSYAESMKTASQRGVQIYTIAASGMDQVGQVIWRQIAQYTGGTNMFVLRGGAGPQSTGGGDPQSSCGGTQKNFASGNLDALIVNKIRVSLAALDADPMRIPGVDRDEKAKPCNERITIMAQ